MDQREQPFILGIDEAGRGPVLGHMVYSTCVCPAARREDLAKLNFDDSKALTVAQRERMFEQIQACEWIGFKLDPISPMAISAAMLKRNKTSLNELATNSTIALVQAWLNEGFNVQEMYVDTLGSPEHYQAKLARQFPQIGKVVVAKKADSLYPIVSAASICAKVTRDQLLREWRPPGLSEGQMWPIPVAPKPLRSSSSNNINSSGGEEQDDDEDVGVTGEDESEDEAPPTRGASSRRLLGKRGSPEPFGAPTAEDGTGCRGVKSSCKRLKLAGNPLVYSNAFGSGYPGDPTTKKWLSLAMDPVFGFPSLVRHSWKTASVLVDTHCAPADWGEDEEGGNLVAGKKASAAKDSKLQVLVSAQISAKHDVQQMARANHFRQHGLWLVVNFE